MRSSIIVGKTSQGTLISRTARFDPKALDILRKSWYEAFRNHVMPAIDTSIFNPLYSHRTNARRSSPIDIKIGVLVIKEFFGLSDGNV
jgi:hypothetical protein